MHQSAMRISREGRRRKYYKLSPAGLRMLRERKREWQAFSKGVQGVLGLQFAG